MSGDAKVLIETAARRFVEEVPAEDLVVGDVVLVAADQRRPPGPVQVDQIGRVERGHGREIGEHVAGADGQAGGPQLVGEADQHARERFSHRR